MDQPPVAMDQLPVEQQPAPQISEEENQRPISPHREVQINPEIPAPVENHVERERVNLPVETVPEQRLKEPQHPSETAPQLTPSIPRTRSGRKFKMPKKFAEFVWRIQFEDPVKMGPKAMGQNVKGPKLCLSWEESSEHGSQVERQQGQMTSNKCLQTIK